MDSAIEEYNSKDGLIVLRSDFGDFYTEEIAIGYPKLGLGESHRRDQAKTYTPLQW